MINVAAHNVTYGSQLSPARFKQICAAVDEYWEFLVPRTDAWLNHWLPRLIKDLKLDVDIGSPECAEDCLT